MEREREGKRGRERERDRGRERERIPQAFYILSLSLSAGRLDLISLSLSLSLSMQACYISLGAAHLPARGAGGAVLAAGSNRDAAGRVAPCLTLVRVLVSVLEPLSLSLSPVGVCPGVQTPGQYPHRVHRHTRA